MRFLVAGANGQLGEAFARALRDEPDVLLRDVQEMDLADDGVVRATVSDLRPDVIVNCAAWTDVDGAEDHPLDALRVNALGVRSLAEAASGAGATLIHFGTDFVFDGRATAPYTEDDWPNPQSVYGASKLLGEEYAARAPRHYVLRLSSLFGGSARRSFIDRIVLALLAGHEIEVFRDRTVSPSYAPDVARAALALVSRGAAPGIFHCTASGYATWLELARELEQLLGTPSLARGVTCSKGHGRAVRPRFCALSNERLCLTGIRMPDWRDTLRSYVRGLGVGGACLAPPGSD